MARALTSVSEDQGPAAASMSGASPAEDDDEAGVKTAYGPVKRILDVVGAGLLLFLLSPLLVLAAIAIKMGDGGPVLFWQERLGQRLRPFRVAKFRTMAINAEAQWRALPDSCKRADGAIKIRDDPRVTAVGRLLRRFSMDELAQLLNVLKGEMSLIGPRPFVPGEVDEYPRERFIRHQVRPGITGLAQIRGRSDLDLLRILAYDAEYVRRCSLSLDLSIAVQTPLVILGGKGAQ